jgi:flagellar biosynthesis GTPase FlhF
MNSMIKVKNRLFSLRTVLFAATLFFLWPICAEGAMYKYIDKNGTVNFTDCYECIPKEYRNKVQRLREEPRPQTPAELSVEEGKRTTEESVPKEQTRQSREAEREKQEAEERAASEKAEQERKLQAREEKERRIEELTQQIAAKEEEINNLRTTWMVYDRTNLYRLTGEIEALKKEVQAIQDSLAADK